MIDSINTFKVKMNTVQQKQKRSKLSEKSKIIGKFGKVKWIKGIKYTNFII